MPPGDEVATVAVASWLDLRALEFEGVDHFAASRCSRASRSSQEKIGLCQGFLGTASLVGQGRRLAFVPACAIEGFAAPCLWQVACQKDRPPSAGNRGIAATDPYNQRGQEKPRRDKCGSRISW